MNGELKVKKRIYIEIGKILSELNYSYLHIGTKLLLDCIYEVYKMEKIYDINLENEVYPIISQKYKKSKLNIKCSINYATTQMYYNTNKRCLYNFFGFKIIEKPKPKDIIIEVIKKLNEYNSFEG